ncbi:MAG TPA: YdcF family protein [Pyrinomonadaceae bacterium]|nr:YdcF family protein [Pyrinomonadaceae bacterium]
MSIAVKVRTVAFSLAATLVLYLVCQFISLRTQNYLTSVPRSDCLVILGAAVWPGGQPSFVLRDRLARAAELYRQGTADKIICTGGLGRNPPPEAEVCRQTLMQTGVPEQAIIMELESTSTSEQAKLIKEICDREGFKSIALVTSFYHERRATQLLRSAGLTEIADARCTHERFEGLNFWVGREALALAVMNWWQWVAPGLAAGALALWYGTVRRQRERA